MAAGSPAWSGARARASDSVGASPGVKTTTRQPGGARGSHPGPQQRALAHTRRPDHRQQPPGADLAPQRRGLGLAAEEAVGVGLGEGGQAGVRIVLLFRRRRRLGNRRRGLGGRGHRPDLGDQPVAALADGLDVAGDLGVVAEGAAQLGDSGGDGVVGHELGLPDRVEEVAASTPPHRRAPPGTAARRWPCARAGSRFPARVTRLRLGSTSHSPTRNGLPSWTIVATWVDTLRSL